MDCLEFFDKLSINYSKNLLMKNLTSLSVGGVCKVYVKPKSVRELQQVIDCFNDYNIAYKIVGNGSNLLVSDKGYNGAIISLKEFNKITLNENVLTVGSGVTLQHLNAFCLKNEIGGFEPLVSIPATIGGAIVMNAGAFGNSISNNLISVNYFVKDRLYTRDKEKCGFAYRKSIFQNKKAVIISANFNARNCFKDIIFQNIVMYRNIRKQSQPSHKSCGSVFRNPNVAPAGFLIENCGVKGFKIGGAEISKKHANFITVSKDCTANDVYNLIQYVKACVYDKFGVKLIEEVEYVGEF